MGETIMAYKGMDKNMKCRGSQYEVGKEYEVEGRIKVCDNGFHACERPLDVFDYYPPSESRYFAVEQSGELDKAGDKTASSRIKIGAEIGIPGLVKAHVEYVKRKCTNEKSAGNCGAATAGDCGAATAGYYGAATAGNCGAATAGNCGAATAGNYGAATAGDRGAATSRGRTKTGANGLSVARGNNVKVCGGIGAVLVIAEEREDSFEIAEWKAVVVDGKNIKPDTWYALKNGEFVEAD